MYKIVEFSHVLIKDFINNHKHENMILIDATCGRGNDTIYMARLVEGFGHVYSYDIQEDAIKHTKELLDKETISNVTLKFKSHEFIDEEDFDLIIFNLGYLPLGNKTITTNHNTTLKAVQSVIKRLESFKHDALIIIAVYPGHDEGKRESNCLDDLVKNLSSHNFLVTKFMNYNRPTSPYILTISKN